MAIASILWPVESYRWCLINTHYCAALYLKCQACNTHPPTTDIFLAAPRAVCHSLFCPLVIFLQCSFHGWLEAQSLVYCNSEITVV